MAGVKINNFSNAIANVLEKYGDKVSDVLDEAIKDAAKQGQKELKKTSPRRTGAYARSWAVQDTGTRLSPGYTIYSKKPGLPHLLEYGHAKRGGGRTTPQPHISPANDSIPDLIEDKIRSKL